MTTAAAIAPPTSAANRNATKDRLRPPPAAGCSADAPSDAAPFDAPFGSAVRGAKAEGVTGSARAVRSPPLSGGEILSGATLGGSATPGFSGKHYTVIAALSLTEVSAAWLLEEAMTGEAFDVYVTQVLAPTLQVGDVILIDNLKQVFNFLL